MSKRLASNDAEAKRQRTRFREVQDACAAVVGTFNELMQSPRNIFPTLEMQQLIAECSDLTYADLDQLLPRLDQTLWRMQTLLAPSMSKKRLVSYLDRLGSGESEIKAVLTNFPTSLPRTIEFVFELMNITKWPRREVEDGWEWNSDGCNVRLLQKDGFVSMIVFDRMGQTRGDLTWWKGYQNDKTFEAEYNLYWYWPRKREYVELSEEMLLKLIRSSLGEALWQCEKT